MSTIFEPGRRVNPVRIDKGVKSWVQLIFHNGNYPSVGLALPWVCLTVGSSYSARGCTLHKGREGEGRERRGEERGKEEKKKAKEKRGREEGNIREERGEKYRQRRREAGVFFFFGWVNLYVRSLAVEWRWW